MATILTIFDFSNGFNRIDHRSLIIKLYNLDMPAWILGILISYPQDRKLFIRYKDGILDPADLIGGVGHGTLLGMWLFLIRINRFSCSQKGDGSITKTITKTANRSVMVHTKKTWIDDLSDVTCVDLKKDAAILPEDRLT